MTQKEKAEEIYYKFTSYAPLHKDNKQCALIAVDLIISYCCADDVLFLHKVKEEIEKL